MIAFLDVIIGCIQDRLASINRANIYVVYTAAVEDSQRYYSKLQEMGYWQSSKSWHNTFMFYLKISPWKVEANNTFCLCWQFLSADLTLCDNTASCGCMCMCEFIWRADTDVHRSKPGEMCPLFHQRIVQLHKVFMTFSSACFLFYCWLENCAD